jgi:hypothetical protein
MATPKKGWLQKSFEFAKENKWTVLGSGAAWMVGIPVVPGAAELLIGGGAGAFKDYKDREKAKKQKRLPKNKRKGGGSPSIFDR